MFPSLLNDLFARLDVQCTALIRSKALGPRHDGGSGRRECTREEAAAERPDGAGTTHREGRAKEAGERQ